MTSCLLSQATKHFQKRSTFKGKNLLLMEQILTFNSCPLLRRDAKTIRAELLPLKVYPFTLSYQSPYLVCQLHYALRFTFTK